MTGRFTAEIRRFVMPLVLFAACGAPPPVAAHDQSFSYVDVVWRRDRIDVRLSVHRDDAAAALGFATPESLMTAPVLARESGALARRLVPGLIAIGDGHPLAWRCVGVTAVPAKRAVMLALSAPTPHRIANLHVEARLFPDNAQHETFLNVYSDGRLMRQAVLTAAEPGVELYDRGPAGVLAVIGTFVRAGIHHIFIGPDHILFVVGLLLMGGGFKRVLKVITAFTAAHSITLALAATGVVNVPGRLVEPLIALSIVYIGIENLRASATKRDHRAALAFGFGLVHGLGFANVLREFGLPREALGWSLLAFNLGVEAGQACIVLAITPILALLRATQPRAALRTVTVGTCAIIVAGTFWFFQRLLVRG